MVIFHSYAKLPAGNHILTFPSRSLGVLGQGLGGSLALILVAQRHGTGRAVHFAGRAEDLRPGKTMGFSRLKHDGK
jgi:hypothetical protein